jgi:hypothetical protein
MQQVWEIILSTSLQTKWDIVQNVTSVQIWTENIGFEQGIWNFSHKSYQNFYLDNGQLYQFKKQLYKNIKRNLKRQVRLICVQCCVCIGRRCHAQRQPQVNSVQFNERRKLPSTNNYYYYCRYYYQWPTICLIKLSIYCTYFSTRRARFLQTLPPTQC